MMNGMPKNLVIVESPSKARTIEKFLGSDYMVKSSYGHIRDLPKKGLNIDINNNFEPQYDISTDKKKIVSELKKLAKGNNVLLASDEDREGEAIAWHLAQALKLDLKSTKRIVFHEITKTAIEQAVQNPRLVDINLVNAQQARRVLDRLVGYELSPLLWKKIKPGLSAGRVQSVAVRLIVEREREIKDFKRLSSFKVNGTFNYKDQEFISTLNHTFNSIEDTHNWLISNIGSKYIVKSLETKPSRRNPSAPFTTSTLQQDASRKLGYSVKQTMTLAQRLYESGHITYMRTDSTLLSELALNAAKKYINDNFGANYHHFRQYKTKNQSAQEAHEAIRPTNIQKKSISAESGEQKLYELIWKRTVASQMAEAKIDITELTITISNLSELFVSKGETLVFDGFMKVYGGTKEDILLPKLSINSELKAKEIVAKEQLNRGPARYSEASLVKKLEELGIGRPSTYSPTISTIQTRGYVEKKDIDGVEHTFKKLCLIGDNIEHSEDIEIIGADKNKLVPTAIAEITTDFLSKYFPTIVDYDFTASVEKHFDEIAIGKLIWSKMIKNFYSDFHPLIESTQDVSRYEVSKARLLGNDPKSKKPIYARFGKYGPMIQKGEATDEQKPDFAPLPKNTTIEDVTLDQALEMFKLPRVVGKTEDGQEIIANIGRFGPYIKIGEISISIKNYDPHDISVEDSIALYKEKLEKEKERNIKQFNENLKILNGPYGPYVTNGKINARIAKDLDPLSITLEEAKKLIENAPKKKRKFKSNKTK